MTRHRTVLATVLALTLLATPAVAHVPDFAADNTSPASAHAVDPPTKSWAIYDALAPEQVRYYELRLDAGDRLSLALFTPGGGPFEPSMAIMSPALDANEAVPSRVEVPDGYGTLVVDGEKASNPTFEPNTPAANYDVASFERKVDDGGRYLVAVYGPDGRAGKVGVVAGDRESFTPVEYVTVAWALPRIYLWEGDHPLVVFGPTLLVVAGGLVAVRRRLGPPGQADGWKEPNRSGESGPPGGPDQTGGYRARYALAGAGLLCVGTAASVLVQTVLALAAAGPTVAAVVPLVFVLLPAALGGAVVARSVDPAFALSRRDRAFLVVAGVLTLGTWAGYVVAPLALLVGAAAPREWVRSG